MRKLFRRNKIRMQQFRRLRNAKCSTNKEGRGELGAFPCFLGIKRSFILSSIIYVTIFSIYVFVYLCLYACPPFAIYPSWKVIIINIAGVGYFSNCCLLSPSCRLKRLSYDLFALYRYFFNFSPDS